MDPCCLVCRASEVDELISVACVTSTARKTIREMIDIFVVSSRTETCRAADGFSTHPTLQNVRANQLLLENDNVVDRESCRLPELVCDQCLVRLERAFRVWKQSRSVRLIRKCDKGAEEHYRACRVCAKGDALVSMFDFCEGRRVQIATMVEYVVNLRVAKGDRLPPYICEECLKDLDQGYGFKKDALESIKYFRDQWLHPWQKMQFRVDCPRRLVVEVSSEGVLSMVDGTTVVTCSVCSARVRSGQLKRACSGCRLKFRNYDELAQKVEEQRRVDEVDLMDLFDGIADYDEVVDNDIGNLMNDEMLVEVEKLPEKIEAPSVPKKVRSPKKPRKLKLISIVTKKKAKDKKAPIKRPAAIISIETIIEYKCCFAGCSQYGVVKDLQTHFQEAHYSIPLEPMPSPFSCPICSATFMDADSLKGHYGEPCPLYKCSHPVCPFATRSHECALRHIEHINEEKQHGYPAPIDIKHLGKYFVVDKPLDENGFTLKRLHERCCWCGELFMDIYELKAHRELMHDVVKGKVFEVNDATLYFLNIYFPVFLAPFQCETCNRPFEARLPLSRHRQRSSLRTHYYCRPCERTFWEVAPYKVHKYSEHVTGPEAANEADQDQYEAAICCCGCEETFESAEQLEDHRRVMHPPDELRVGHQFPCQSCGKAFPLNQKLQVHLRKYQSGHLYRCLVLGCVFKTTIMANIKIHVAGVAHKNAQGKTLTIRRVNPSIFYCCVSRCAFEHSSYDEIVKHVASAHEVQRQRNEAHYCDEESFRCEACFKKCPTELSFLNHKNGRKALSCKYCKNLHLRAELAAHEAICPKRAEFVCEVCSKRIIGKFRFKQHMQTDHAIEIVQPPNDKPKPVAPTPKVICTICGLLVKKHILVHHMQSKHEQKRAFKCEQCGSRFNVLQLLKTHLKNVHSAEKLYPCRQDGCEKRYKHAGDRQRHEQMVHLGITPFKCDVCSESFVRDRDLRLHARKHTGRKLYGCDQCGADYDRLTEFREHQRVCGSAGRIVGKIGKDE